MSPRLSDHGKDQRTGGDPGALRRRHLANQLETAVALLSERLEHLEPAARAGDAEAWSLYVVTLQTVTAVLERLEAQHSGHLLTTREFAERLGVQPKALLKHKARGAVRPALVRGKWIRWRGDERIG